jgi:hypothetical protein
MREVLVAVAGDRTSSGGAAPIRLARCGETSRKLEVCGFDCGGVGGICSLKEPLLVLGVSMLFPFAAIMHRYPAMRCDDANCGPGMRRGCPFSAFQAPLSSGIHNCNTLPAPISAPVSQMIRERECHPRLQTIAFCQPGDLLQ